MRISGKIVNGLFVLAGSISAIIPTVAQAMEDKHPEVRCSWTNGFTNEKYEFFNLFSPKSFVKKTTTIAGLDETFQIIPAKFTLGSWTTYVAHFNQEDSYTTIEFTSGIPHSIGLMEVNNKKVGELNCEFVEEGASAKASISGPLRCELQSENVILTIGEGGSWPHGIVVDNQNMARLECKNAYGIIRCSGQWKLHGPSGSTSVDAVVEEISGGGLIGTFTRAPEYGGTPLTIACHN